MGSTNRTCSLGIGSHLTELTCSLSLEIHVPQLFNFVFSRSEEEALRGRSWPDILVDILPFCRSQ